jgi:TonB family protein
MKRTMLAILAISPVMLHAQVKSPAQPGSTPTVVASNYQPAAFAGISSPEHAAALPSIRVSTGVIAPVLVHQVAVDRDHILQGTALEDRTVSVGMTVDASGKPTNLKVLEPIDAFTDQAILSAASQYRFKPAHLDGTAVPMEMTLNFKIVD